MSSMALLFALQGLRWHPPYALRAGNLNFGLQAQERRRRVGRERRPALCPSRGNVAEVSIFLDAESAGFTPGERLVVPETTRVQTNIAANCAHIAEDGRSDGFGGFRQH